jgi:hypothetical protein
VLFYVLFVCKCVLSPGDNTIVVNKYIASYHRSPKNSKWINQLQLKSLLSLSLSTLDNESSCREMFRRTPLYEVLNLSVILSFCIEKTELVSVPVSKQSVRDWENLIYCQVTFVLFLHNACSHDLR